MKARLSNKEAAERLGIAPATLVNYRWRGYGPKYLKIGNRVQYNEADIDAWLDDQVEAPAKTGAAIKAGAAA